MDQSASSAMAAKAHTLYLPFPRSTASAEAGMEILVAGTEATAMSAAASSGAGAVIGESA
jgi:hypothetical protein